MLNYEFPPIGGGAGKAHHCLLKEYEGNDELIIDVLTSKPEPGFTVEKPAGNIAVYKVGVHKKNLHFWRKTEVLEWLIKASVHYRKLLRKNTYDLAHAFFGFPTGWLCYRTRGKLPYIISLRGSDVPGYNVRLGMDYKLLSRLFERIWRKAAAVVANSEGLRVLANEFLPDLSIAVIPNGIDPSRFCPAGQRTLSPPVRILSVGRLIERKKIDLLIEATALAKRAGIDIRFNIAGDGNLMDKLRQAADKLKVSQSVNFLGRVPAEEMPKLYRDNDIFVMSSQHEGMSNAMLEAMASGLPIITTHCEGVEELVSDNGIVVEQADAAVIAEAIANLVGDRENYERMCVAARKRAENFSWQSVAGQYFALYQSITRQVRSES